MRSKARPPSSGRTPALLARLRENPVLAQGSDAGLRALAERADVLSFGVGERILDEGGEPDALYAMLEGTVGVFYSSEDGVDVLVKVFGAPSIFGEMEMLWKLPRLEYVETFLPTVVVRFPAAAAQDFLSREGAASFALLRDVARRLCVAAYHERALAFLPVEKRLAGVLLSFLEAHGRRDGDGVTLDLKLTYEMLARCLGVTTRSVDRTFARWLKEGWLEKSRGRYRVRELTRLEEHAAPARLALFHRLSR